MGPDGGIAESVDKSIGGVCVARLDAAYADGFALGSSAGGFSSGGIVPRAPIIGVAMFCVATAAGPALSLEFFPPLSQPATDRVKVMDKIMKNRRFFRFMELDLAHRRRVENHDLLEKTNQSGGVSLMARAQTAKGNLK